MSGNCCWRKGQAGETRDKGLIACTLAASHRTHTRTNTCTAHSHTVHSYTLEHLHLRTLISAHSRTRTVAHSRTRARSHTHIRTCSNEHTRTRARLHARTLAHLHVVEGNEGIGDWGLGWVGGGHFAMMLGVSCLDLVLELECASIGGSTFLAVVPPSSANVVVQFMLVTVRMWCRFSHFTPA